jgi:transposase
VVAHPVHNCPHCGGTRFCQRGEDRREVIEYVPARFKVVVHVRPRMSCRSCERMVQMPMPALPIERGLGQAELLILDDWALQPLDFEARHDLLEILEAR